MDKFKVLLKFGVCGLLAVVLYAACSGLIVDYGKPVAQFHEASVLEKGPEYLGQKITVKGVVTGHDLSDLDNCLVYLNHGIVANFGDLNMMAESCKVGSEVYVDGILKRCEKGDILLDPAIGRDHRAKFEPVE